MNDTEKKMFLGLYQMLLADSEVHPNELDTLYQIGKEKGNITKEEIQSALFSPNTFTFIEDLNDDEKIEYLYNLTRMAWADGKIDEKEKEALKITSNLLGFSEDNADQIIEFLLENAKNKISFIDVLNIIKNS